MESTFAAVRCTRCDVRMTEHRGAEGRVQYFRCPGCKRWMSSTYAGVLGADAGFRAYESSEEAEEEGFDRVKNRLEAWLASIDERDPYRVLGAQPGASPEDLRRCYRAAAFVQHPDRGGDADAMARLNLAYQRVTEHHHRRPRPALPVHGVPQRGWRPAAQNRPVRTPTPR